MNASTPVVSAPSAAPIRPPTAALPAVGPNSPQPIRTRLIQWINHSDWIAAVLITIVAIILQARFVSHVGGLWRDEANSVQLATLPRLADVWHSLDFDSFPLLFFGVLRSWTALFGTHNGTAIRALGLMTGLCIVGATWLTARSFGAKTPVLSLSLIGLNPMIIRYGESTRAYGLGILLILLTFAAFWRLTISSPRPHRGWIATATLLAVLSVHCVYYNSVLLLSIIAASLVVCVRNRWWRTAAIAFGIGVIAAASLLPYAPIIYRMRSWTFLVSHPVDLAWLWKRSCEVFGSPDPLAIGIWISLYAASLAVAAILMVRWLTSDAGGPNSSRFRLPDSALFAVVALLVAIPAYAGFLRLLNYYTQPWYYITLAAFAAAAIDVFFGVWPITSPAPMPMLIRSARPLVAWTLLSLTISTNWKEITTRHTNIDLIANRLQSLTKTGDVVLVPQWENAVSLSYHYHGPAGIVTVPDISDHRFHRYDLVLLEMGKQDPAQPVRERLRETLRSNHSVFIAGALPFPPESIRLHRPRLAPGQKPDAATGGAYYLLWQLQVGQFLRGHIAKIGDIAVPVPGNERVQSFENVSLQVVRGWKE